MGRRGEELAARFRVALDTVEIARRREEAERLARLAEGRQARESLFDDLAAVGEGIGHVAVQRGESGVTLRWNDRFLHFEPMGEGDRVRIAFDEIGEDEHRLYREPGLGNRWVWVLRRRGREDRLPLFDQGLEELLVLGLKLPRPGDVAASVAPQPTLDDAVPAPSAITDQGEDDRLPDEQKRKL